MSKIEILPFGASLFDFVIENFPQNSTFVFPTRRAVYYFKERLWRRRGKKTVALPRVLSIEEFWKEIFHFNFPAYRILEKGEEVMLLLNSIKKSTFYTRWGRDKKVLRSLFSLLSFFQELEEFSLTIPKVKEAGIVWADEEWENLLSDLENLQQIFYRDLQDNHVVTMGMAYRMMGEKAGREEVDLPFPLPVVLGGIISLNLQEERVIRRMLESDKGRIIMMGDERVREPQPVFSPFYHIQRFLNSWLGEVNFHSAEKREAEVDIYRCSGREEEIIILGEKLKELLNKFLPEKIAIIVPYPSLARRIEEEILKPWQIKYNITAGIPFIESQAYTFLFSFKTLRDSNFQVEKYYSFLQHPFSQELNFPSPEELLHKAKELRAINLPASILKKEGKKFENLAHFLDRMEEISRLSLPYFLESILYLLKDFFQKGDFYMREEGREISQVLREISSFSHIEMEKEEKWELTLQFLRNRSLHLFGEPLEGVQVLGVLESRFLDFEAVIIPDFNEGIFPSFFGRDDPFLSPTLRERLNLPTPSSREALYGYYLEYWRGKCHRLIILYQEDEEGEFLPSRFVERLHYFEKREIKDAEFLYGGLNSSSMDLSFNPGEEMKKMIEEKSCLTLPASALLEFLRCPLLFYFRYLKGISYPEKFGEPQASVVGRILHEALRDFYKEGWPESKRKESLEELVDKKWGEYLPLNGYSLLVKEMIKEYFVPYFLRMEEQIYSQEPFQVKNVEREGRFRISSPFPIEFTYRVDRLDLRPDGSYRLVDYKFGRSVEKKAREEIRYQMGLYTWWLREEGIPLSQIRVYHLLKRRTETIEEMNPKEAEEKARSITMQILEDIIKGKWNLPTFSECLLCPYRDLCRRV